MSAHAEQCARDLPRRGRARPAQSGPSTEARRSKQPVCVRARTGRRPYKSDVLQWQEEALVELVDDRGVIYIRGGMSLVNGEQMRIVVGALITEDTVHLGRGALLEVTHSMAARALPGLIVLDNGRLVVTQQARLRVHGLVYVNGAIDIGEKARVDVVGAVLANDPGLSFRSLAAAVVIRYDPAVLGTPGLRVSTDAPVVAWVAAWEELP